MAVLLSSIFSSKKYEGATWKVLSGLCFASVNGLAKMVELPVVQTVCLQNLIGSFLLMGILGTNVKGVFLKKAYLYRSLAALPGVLFWLSAIRRLPLSQAVALGFLGPFFTTLGAKIFLKETLGLKRMMAIFLGSFGGIIVVYGGRTIEYDIRSFDYTIVLPILATLSFSISSLIGKYLSLKEKPLPMACSLMMYLGLLLLPSLPFWICPSGMHFFILILLGALAALAHFSMGQAFCCADLIFLLPFGSTRFIASTLIGWYIYDQMPTYWVFIGMIVTLGGLWILASAKK